MTYRAPVSDIAFTLKNSAGFRQALDDGIYGDLDADDGRCRARGGGPFATDVIAPLNSVGDKFGTPFKDGAVTTPPGWKDAYRAWAAAGWNAARRARGDGAARPCRTHSTPHASRCGIRRRWLSASARC